MEFSEKVRFVRSQLGMSQEELAQALNVSYASIHRWEHAKAKPIKIALTAFNAFCKKRGITFDDSGKQSGSKGGGA